MEVHKDDPTRYRWWSDVNSYHNLDAQIKFGPTYLYEYSTREAYGSGITWGANDPLNATWWHRVTESASPTCLSSPYFSLSNFPFFCLQKWKRTRALFRCEDSRVSLLRCLSAHVSCWSDVYKFPR